MLKYRKERKTKRKTTLWFSSSYARLDFPLQNSIKMQKFGGIVQIPLKNENKKLPIFTAFNSSYLTLVTPKRNSSVLQR